MRQKLLLFLLFLLLLLPGCGGAEPDLESSISTSVRNFIEYEEGCYWGDSCEILPDGRHLREGDSLEDAGYLRDPNGDFVKIPDNGEAFVQGFFTEEQAESILADSYCEGYYDAYSGVEASYCEVTEETVNISNYFEKYGLYSEEDLDELCTMYYTSGYSDACNGYEPEYNPCEELYVQEESPEIMPSKPLEEDTHKNENKQETQSTTVYITNTGEKYHRDGCGYLSQSKNAISLSSAQAIGYTPCSRCNPLQ